MVVQIPYVVFECAEPEVLHSGCVGHMLVFGKLQNNTFDKCFLDWEHFE